VTMPSSGDQEEPAYAPPPMADASVPGEGEAINVRDPDPRWAQDFHGLLYLGALRGDFRYLGHRIDIRTLRGSEELMIAILTREWADTMGFARAHATAMAALCTEAVDGQSLPVPLGETSDDMAWARDRFRYAQRWYPFTVDIIFERYLELEGRMRKVIDELGKGPAPGGPPQTPGSSTRSGSPGAEGSSPEDP
jgi:hypothetical protein